MIAKVKYTVDGRDQEDFNLNIDFNCSENDSFKTVKKMFDDFVKKGGWRFEMTSIEFMLD
jgi:hypothetical protein